jgi:glycosyltransferase involved in cell wall biosynthesis
LLAARPLSVAEEAPAVLQLAPRLDPDEVGRDTLDLARHLRVRGWRSLVASAGGSLLRELAAAGATHLPVPLDLDGRLARWRNTGRIARAVREHRVGLVHAHSPSAASSGTDAARAAGVPFVATVRDVEAPAARRGAEALLAGAARVIAVSEFAADTLTARHGVPPDRVRVVRRWVDAAEFDPERVRGHRVLALAERWDLAPGPKVVLVPPLASGDRGHLLLLQALARLPRTDCVALLLAGIAEDADYGETLVAAVRKAGLGERVRFGGEPDDLPAAMALADVVVLPATRADASGIMAAAAQAMGRPLIVTNNGALAEAVMPAATGWLVPPDDPGELARALDLALSMDEGARRRLAGRSRAFVEAEFGLEAMCDRTLGVYRELMGPAVARAG